jgi:chromatin segregation and condensation protein Rec8/ScpA/Scc1 (kleisin family)
MRKKTADMFDMVKDKKNRLEIINVLLALLQLVKDGKVDIQQTQDNRKISVKLVQ